MRSGLPIRIQLDELESSDLFGLPEPNGESTVRIRTPFHFRGHSEIVIAGFRDDFPSANAVRVQLTITNPNAAGRPGGNWDLGNEGSSFLRGLQVTIPAAPPFRISSERGMPFEEAHTVELYQASSGGENWQSESHMDKAHKVLPPFCGYRLNGKTGLRATPVVMAGDIGIAMPTFWENFPIGVKVKDDRQRQTGDPVAGITLQLLDEGLTGQSVEIQGGESKTHTFTVAFGESGITDQPLVWARSPLQVSCAPEWYARCEALPHLTPRSTDPHALYLKLVDQAIEGSDTFSHKREKIDEYGWRNFGDIYGDHEAVRHSGPTPMVSHYNNQYDCVGGFAAQFFRSGDPRWFSQMIECADHTADIDIYHTTGDKAAYNGGLFWHTTPTPIPPTTAATRSVSAAARRTVASRSSIRSMTSPDRSC